MKDFPEKSSESPETPEQQPEKENDNPDLQKPPPPRPEPSLGSSESPDEKGLRMPDAAPSETSQIPPSQEQVSSETSSAADTSRAAPASPSASDRQQGSPADYSEADLDKEVEEALGNMSIMDMMEEETAAIDPASTAVAEAKEVPGVVHGKVIALSNDGVFVDLGGKSQGFLPAEELEEGEQLKEGDRVSVSILRYDQRDGLLILSKKSAEQQLLRHNLKVGSLVEARVIGSNKGGLELDIKGLRGFMPASQVDIGRVEDLDSLMNQRFVCEVTQVERGDKNIVLSRRNVLEREQQEKGEQLWQELQEGQKREGVVRSLADYGVFVDLGGVDGLLHVSELSWARVNHPKDVLEVGQKVEVVVKTIDREKRRVGLSLKLASGNPWQTAATKYAPGTRHEAKVVKIMDFGAFAELESGIEGLIPISEMSLAGRVRHPSDIVQVGSVVEVEVLNLDLDKQRLSLSMKRLEGNPWQGVESKYAAEQVYTGTVVRLTDFGAFVSLEPGIDGLVHISELSDKHVKRPGEVVQEGQEVQVKVLSVDPQEQRIALSMKGIGAEPQAAPEAAKPAEPKKKKERPRRGGLSW